MRRNEGKTLKFLDGLSSLLGVFAFGTLILTFGFPDLPLPSGIMVAWVGIFPLAFIVESLVRLLIVHQPWVYLTENPFRYSILLILILELSGIAGWSAGAGQSRVALVAGQVYLVVFLFAHAGSWIKGLMLANRWLSNLRLPVFLLPALSFGAVIFAGGLLLWLPGMRKAPTSFLDSLFTATSALCVTGLTVYDIGSTLSTAGLAVLVGLIQLGGIGTMTVIGALAIWLGGSLTSRERLAFSELIGGKVPGETRRILARVLKIVFAFEAVGTLLLWALWNGKIAHPLLFAFFHSVSAFCNAGFSLFPDSLGSFASDAPILFVLMALIVAGGLGIPALSSLGASAASRLAPWKDRRSLPKSVRATLQVSGLLLIAGAGSFLLDGYLTGKGRSVLSALFQSVTTRTAGFQAESQLSFGPLGWAATLLLMAIGASPQSTGGGLKTSVVSRLLTSPFQWKPRQTLSVTGTQPFWTPFRTATVFVVVYLAIGLVSGLVMQILEGGAMSETLFECFSALGTVGLTRDLTPSLSVGSKILVMVLMFTGRVLYPTFVTGLVRARLPEDQHDDWA